MNIDEAIKILKKEDNSVSFPPNPEVHEALQLGIEALERTRKRRDILGWMHEPLMPGETAK